MSEQNKRLSDEELTYRLCDLISDNHPSKLAAKERVEQHITALSEELIAARLISDKHLSDRLTRDGMITKLQEELRQAKGRERCEHCGSNDIYHGPPDCPLCGAPNCCRVCCRIVFLEGRLAEKDKETEQIKFRTADAMLELVKNSSLANQTLRSALMEVYVAFSTSDPIRAMAHKALNDSTNPTEGERWVNAKEVERTVSALHAGLKLGEHCKLNPTAYVNQIKEELTRLQQLISGK